MDKVIRSQYRIPASLVAWLKEKARCNSRSLNGELIELMKKAKQEEEKTAWPENKKPLSVLPTQIEASGSKCYQHKEPISKTVTSSNIKELDRQFRGIINYEF